MTRQCDHSVTVESRRSRAAGAVVFVTLVGWSGTAHATALDGMFNHWATDTWFIGVPLGFFMVVFGSALKRAVDERLWRGILYGLLLLLIGPSFALWLYLGMDDGWTLPIAALTLTGAAAVLYVWHLVLGGDDS